MTSEKLVSEEYPELFHYTTVSALESIYKQRKFRATHYEDLNDATELGRFRLAVGKFIRPTVLETIRNLADGGTLATKAIQEDGGIDVAVDRGVETHLNTLQQATFGKTSPFPDTFICSFCAHKPQSYAAQHGLLSQWRGYSGAGGVALVLDTLGIENLLAQEGNEYAHSMNHIGSVTYDDDADEIQKEYCEVFEHFPPALKAQYAGQDARPSYTGMLKHFVLGTTLVKHHAFFEEGEIRLVVSPRPRKGSPYYVPEHDAKPRKTIRYAQRAGQEMRYIELFSGASLPIKRVIVGPSRIQNFNCQVVSELVAGTDIEVVPSEIPFVG